MSYENKELSHYGAIDIFDKKIHNINIIVLQGIEMGSSDFIEKRRKQLIHRHESKGLILKNGGQQALSHSYRDLARIKSALKRIEESRYGLCVHCGLLIDEKRLEIIPETPFCTPCAKDVEVQQ